MNIFVTSPWPAESAICLPDKHVVKMPLECCQMLSIVASDKWGHGFGTLPKAVPNTALILGKYSAIPVNIICSRLFI